MTKILTTKKAEEISKGLKSKNKKIVVVGGCFDILHIGHIKFLEKAKNKGDYLFVLLESDNAVKKLKGNERPINNQKDRARVLSAISFVDFVITFDEIKSNKDYDKLIVNLKPDIIAITKNDKQKIHNIRQAKLTGAKVVEVINKIKNKSTTDLAKTIYNNFK